MKRRLALPLQFLAVPALLAIGTLVIAGGLYALQRSGNLDQSVPLKKVLGGAAAALLVLGALWKIPGVDWLDDEHWRETYPDDDAGRRGRAGSLRRFLALTGVILLTLLVMAQYEARRVTGIAAESSPLFGKDWTLAELLVMAIGAGLVAATAFNAVRRIVDKNRG